MLRRLIPLIQPLRLVTESLCAKESPHLLALGLAAGMVAGLVPKDNLTATILAMLLLTLRLHLGAAAMSALIFMWIGSLLDPLSHRVGLAILTFQPLEKLLTRLFDLPFVPWTNLNNSVVLGNLVIGLILAVPMYWLARKGVEKYGPPLAERLEKYRVYKLMRAAEVATTWRAP